MIWVDGFGNIETEQWMVLLKNTVVKKLVYYEYGSDINCIINREKQIKKWNRKKKEFLIKTINPGWIDLSKKMFSFEN